MIDPSQPLTVGDVIALYLRHSTSQAVHCQEAREDRERTFRLFVGAIGSLPVADCRPFHLTDFIENHPGWRRSLSLCRLVQPLAGTLISVSGHCCRLSFRRRLLPRFRKSPAERPLIAWQRRRWRCRCWNRMTSAMQLPGAMGEA